MRPERRAALSVWVSVAAMWLVALWAISRDWGRSWPWLVPVSIASALWVVLEVGRYDRPDLRTILYLRQFMAWIAIALVSLILVQTMASLDGAASTWETLGRRTSGLIVASGLILFGNALPTLTSLGLAERDAAVRQHVHRFVAWTLVVTGLGVGASWIALDPEVASLVTNRLLALGFFLVCGKRIASLFDRSAVGSPTR